MKKIQFIFDKNGQEDYEFLEDLWCAAKEIRPGLPRYLSIQIKKIIIDGIEMEWEPKK